nr:hypothetical protein [uncultured Cellulosilyticum sp.]
MSISNEEVDAIVLWATEIANKTGRSIPGIISRFALANKELKDVEAAKVQVANELINKK